MLNIHIWNSHHHEDDIDIFDNDNVQNNGDQDDNSSDETESSHSSYISSTNTNLDEKKIPHYKENNKMILEILSIVLKRQDALAEQMTRIERMISSLKAIKIIE